jgi:putative heme-binding domain-containing protein
MKNPVIVRSVAEALAKNPALASQQESVYRTLFSGQPPELFGTVVLPALRQAETALDAKKRMLAPLAEKAAAFGNPAAGRAALAAGKGTCVACHRIGDLGRPIGPDLSKIGEIRTERDLVESILFPNNTLARDYEAHVIETSDGQTVAGVIRGHTAEGLLVVDAAGQERNVPHPQIVSNTVLPVSLMPMGLDASLNEQELLDVVAYLHSLR